MRNLSTHQTIVAVIALVCIVVLGALDKVSSDAVVATIGTICGGAVGYINGKKAHAPDTPE